MGGAASASALVAGGAGWYASQPEETARSVAGEKPKPPSPTRISPDGKKADPKLSRVVAPIQTDGKGVIAYMLPTSMRGSEVLHLAAEDGNTTLLMKTPDGVIGEDAFLTFPPENAMFASEAPDPALFTDGRLHLHYDGSFNVDAGVPMTTILGTR
ncbi:hypothetical protein J7E88_28615 [Streptomyces sp. ISL-10]|uniref:hypothetical protein n=1 Tax=Streptomyces sp. ISL-10 TaxID=2819172 RepID=UPI001BEA6B45|nr:hypothetical protein [Streptomyces sp. ISL-10]MBT2369172.1 hypothetical protein [Streptomyces sp. ISL-10]